MRSAIRPRFLLAASLAAASLVSASCGGGSAPPAAEPATPPPAEQWKASEGCPPPPVPDGDFDLLGDPRACKGGRIVLETNSYPTHLNYYGPERDNSLALDYVGAMLLPLVTVHPNTLQVIPQLASSWEETEKGRIFVFHLDADAKWSDGTPLTSKDVVATYDLIMAPETTEVVFKTEFEKWKRPEIVDDKTVRWEAKTASWRNLVLIGDVPIYPAHLTNPKTYLDAWKWQPPATIGPYTLGANESGQYFEFTRVKDWWGAGKRQFIGLYNFDSIYRKVINEDDIAFEFMKKGDIDYYLVTKAQRWVEETEFDKIQKGWIQKQKMYMREPQVPNQMAFNMKLPIFQDPKVRRGLFWLLDREYIHDQITYHQYVNKDSYYANSVYANPTNVKITFNPEKGLALLAEAGWTKKDADGVLMKDGQRMEFDFIYIHQSAERIYTPLQESFRKYGVKMNLKLIQPSAWVKVSQVRDFQLIYANWGSSPFPSPRTLWHSETADKNDTSNVCNFKDPRVDTLIEQYEAEFDLAKRAELMHQIDALIYEQTPYMLFWYSNNWRNLWWDKFGMPEWCSWSSVDIRNTLWATWWYDEAKAKRLEESMKTGTSVPRPPEETTYWKLAK